MTTVEMALIAQPIVAFVVGTGQCVLIAWGISKMSTTGQERQDQLARRELEETKRHEEVMTALRQQGEAFRQQGEAFRQQGEAFRQQGETLRKVGEALREQTEALRQQTEMLRSDRM